MVIGNLTATQQEWLKQNTVSKKKKKSGGGDFSRPPRIEGHREALKEDAREQEMSGHKLDDLVERSKMNLMKIKAIFPFDLFPDEIVIDATKVTVIHNDFFTKNVQSLFVKDIVTVDVNATFLFGSLSIASIRGPITINYLSKNGAAEARKIIQGLIVTAKQDIDLSKVSGDYDFKEKVAALGQATLSNNQVW